MLARATDGTGLTTLVQMAIPICRKAQRQCPRTGPGRKPDFDNWKMAVLIVIALLARRKSKSAQYRFLWTHRHKLQRWLNLTRFPVRSTYFERYRQAHQLFQAAIQRQGHHVIAEGLADASVVAVDKSLLTARGPKWNRKDRQKNRVPSHLHGVDCESRWGYSSHHGWVQGYSYEVVVTACQDGPVWPLLASVDTANVSEHVSFAEKIDALPNEARYVLADGGYDKNEHGERVERGRNGGRHFLCPPEPMFQPNPPSGYHLTRREQHSRQLRVQRAIYFKSPKGQRLYARRHRSVEPFNEWFKQMFDLSDHVWHHGINNNKTQVLGAIFAYQLLLRYNQNCGNRNGQVQWILDGL
jgi:hypothetical protein